jgi:ubiquinone/menaquinone biosynthesis C-methylase UbiE
MYPIIYGAYKQETKHLMAFKEKLPFLNEEEIASYYQRIEHVPITRRPTDLNKASLKYIIKHIIMGGGGGILDAACGRGYLLNKVIEAYPKAKCIGVDIVPSKQQFEVVKADLLSLPFEDHAFDTVLCTHALEHIREHKKALNELIRVTKQRLIIVVPRQREYVYTVDLHVHFFPYMYSFQQFIGIKDAIYLELKGDFLCCIDFK